MDLNIRNFPEAVLRQLKIDAAGRGVTLRELVIEKCGGKDEVSVKAEKQVPLKKLLPRGRGRVSRPVAPMNSGTDSPSPVSLKEEKPKLDVNKMTDREIRIAVREGKL